MRIACALSLLLAVTAAACGGDDTVGASKARPSAATKLSADTIVVDFESGPPVETAVNDDYRVSSFTRFFVEDFGFRPYRKTVAANLAHSGTTVANVGPDLCGPAEGAQGAECEFVYGGTSGRFTRTASSVKVFAGRFTQDGNPADVQLKAYRGNGTLITQSPVTPIGLGFNTPVTVTSAGNDIARFELAYRGTTGVPVGFDDLTIDFPAGTVADVSLAGPLNPTSVLQGTTTDIAIALTRINNSDGPITLSATGLPTGVSAQFQPNPVPGIQEASVMRLTATVTAPRFFQPTDITVKAESIPPNAQTLPGPRTLAVPVTVRTQFDLSQANPGQVPIPQCAPVDVGLRVARDLTFSLSKTVTLSVSGLPAGVTAEFVPSATIPPGGGLTADTTLRFRRSTGNVPAGSTVTVRATAPSAPDRTLSLTLAQLAATATLDSTTASGAVPSRLQPGSRIRLSGNGFCPGTKVLVGNDLAEADTELEPSSTALTFRLPRLATSGTVKVVPPGGAAVYGSSNAITVRSTRNTSGFQFNNPGWGNLSFDEITALFGTEEMFLSTNPCWPWSDCTIALPIPDPIAYAKWQIIEQIVQESGGHCFGISRFLQEIGAGRITNAQFASGVTKTFDLPSRTGPNSALSHYLDHRHAGQTSKEFLLLAYGVRSDSISSQLNRLRTELTAGRLAGVMVKNGFTKGHVITAHDMETLQDGSTVIHTYDNETEFIPEEESDASGVTHRDRENASRVIVNAAKTRWDYTGGGWHGGNDGSFYVSLLSDWPKGTQPTLPGVVDALIGIFGSAGGAAVTKGPPKGAEILPVLDRSAIPGAAGFVIGEKGTRTVTHVMEGKKAGTYSQMVMGSGFIGSVNDVRTGKGVTDRLTATPRNGVIEFAGETTRPLELVVASETPAASRIATIHTRTFAGGGETVELSNGAALVYEHKGSPTRFSFELSSLQRGSGASHFESGPLTVNAGDRIVATPVDWKALSTVDVSVRRANGSRSSVRVRNKAKSLPVRISITGLRVRAVRGRPEAQVTTRLRRVSANSVQGVSLRLTRDGRTMARRGFAVKRPGTKAQTFRWQIPLRVRRGVYRLVADVSVASSGVRLGTKRVTRQAVVRIP